MIRSEKPQVEVWLALDNAVKQQQKTQYDLSPSCDLNAPRCELQVQKFASKLPSS